MTFASMWKCGKLVRRCSSCTALPAAALQLAATLPPDSPACGLATSDLLASPLAVNEGRMQLPTESGLGVELDRAALKRYSSGEEEWA